MKVCKACNSLFGREHFSNTQWRAKNGADTRRCIVCIAAGRPAGRSVGRPSSVHSGTIPSVVNVRAEEALNPSSSGSRVTEQCETVAGDASVNTNARAAAGESSVGNAVSHQGNAARVTDTSISVAKNHTDERAAFRILDKVSDLSLIFMSRRDQNKPLLDNGLWGSFKQDVWNVLKKQTFPWKVVKVVNLGLESWKYQCDVCEKVYWDYQDIRVGQVRLIEAILSNMDQKLVGTYARTEGVNVSTLTSAVSSIISYCEEQYLPSNSSPRRNRRQCGTGNDVIIIDESDEGGGYIHNNSDNNAINDEQNEGGDGEQSCNGSSTGDESESVKSSSDDDDDDEDKDDESGDTKKRSIDDESMSGPAKKKSK